jgi:uncharacterized membrane protein YhaH (DUF805 family)
VQAADLTTWRGEANHPHWARFARAVYAAARPGAPPPPEQAVSPSQTPRAAAAPTHGATGAVEQLSPIGYVLKCLRHYADGKGRARRSELGWFFVFAFLVGVAAAIADLSLFGFDPYTGAANSYAVTLLAGLALLAPTISVASRRAHDFGQTGWLAAFTAVPYVGALVALVFIFIPGQRGPNQYGPDPKGL